MFMITPMPADALKPGSAAHPFPGVEADIYEENGQPAEVGAEGYLVLKRPWPAMLRTIYKDPGPLRQAILEPLPWGLFHRR